MKQTLKSKILDLLEARKGWTHNKPLAEMALIEGFKPSTVDRECRLMTNDGMLDRDECDCVSPRHVVYKFKSREKQPLLNFNGQPIK